MASVGHTLALRGVDPELRALLRRAVARTRARAPQGCRVTLAAVALALLRAELRARYPDVHARGGYRPRGMRGWTMPDGAEYPREAPRAAG